MIRKAVVAKLRPKVARKTVKIPEVRPYPLRVLVTTDDGYLIGEWRMAVTALDPTFTQAAGAVLMAAQSIMDEEA